MASVDTLIVDKTGTLTEGRPRLTDAISRGALAEEAILGLAAALELGSEHPLAEAIVEGCGFCCRHRRGRARDGWGKGRRPWQCRDDAADGAGYDGCRCQS